jgi:hypothetical protein
MRSAEASRYASEVTRSFIKTDGKTCTASPSPDTPKSLCNVSAKRNSIQSRGEREAIGRNGKEESRNVSTSQARWQRQFLFLFNLEAVGPNVDAHAFGLLAILIKLIPHYRDDNYQRADE